MAKETSKAPAPKATPTPNPMQPGPQAVQEDPAKVQKRKDAIQKALKTKEPFETTFSKIKGNKKVAPARMLNETTERVTSWWQLFLAGDTPIIVQVSNGSVSPIMLTNQDLFGEFVEVTDDMID